MVTNLALAQVAQVGLDLEGSFELAMRSLGLGPGAAHLLWLPLPMVLVLVAAQWALWGMGVMAAFVFAFLFHELIDTPIQNRIRAWLKSRSRRPVVVTQPAVSLGG